MREAAGGDAPRRVLYGEIGRDRIGSVTIAPTNFQVQDAQLPVPTCTYLDG